MLRYRVLTALWLVPLFLVVLYVGSWAFGAFLALLAVLGAVEMDRLLRTAGHEPSLAIIAGFPLVLLAIAYLAKDTTGWAIALLLVVSLVIYIFRSGAPAVLLPSWGLTLAAAVYLGWPLQHFALLRQAEDFPLWSGAALVGTWLCDTGAYLVGRAIGRHKLFPRVSPGKTWEGTIGGVVVAIALGVALASPLHLAWWLGAVLGLLVGVTAVLGDLAESFLKRATGAKDSGGLLAGHGGVLDRIDSLLFVVLAVYYFRAIVTGTL